MLTFDKKDFLAWLWVILCSIAIFLTVPVARKIQRFVYNKWGRELFLYFVLVALAVACLIMFYFLIFRLRVKSLSNYVWLLIISTLYVYFTLKLKKVPEETVHFLEYGLLSFFLFKAISHHVKDKSIYITATLFTLLIGTFDEILQWITPQRYWDFKDAGLNALSGGLFQLAVWKVVRPKFISEKFSARSLKIFSCIFASCLIILGLCVLNTPNRVYNYTKKLQFLSYLQKEESMSEFGFKYKDPEIGVFYSRLSPKSLKKTDEQRGNKYVQILNESVNKDYEQFLREYSPTTDPFMHELSVHIFRRDTHLNKARAASQLSEKKDLYFISYKENLILQKYFTKSLEKSVYSWDENKIKEAEALIDKIKPYKSPVSANLFTSFSEKTVWISIVCIISFLGVVNLIFSYIKNKS
jgi:VanZ family protein